MPDAMAVRTVVAEVTGGPERGLRWEGERCSVGTAADNPLALTDEAVSRYHLRLAATAGGVEVVDFGSTNGTFIDGVRVRHGVAQFGSTICIGHSEIHLSAGAPCTVPLHDEDHLGSLRGRSRAMRRLMGQIRRAAPSRATVLLVGESGTGKELLARCLHDEGPRAGRPFVTVDCGAVTPTLIAAELFGHERGAFTGAVNARVGAFERAHGGTLFLDEVGELPVEIQASLLGALERRRFCRLGGDKEVLVDVRVVSATNRDLRTAVNDGSFRLDLYYRLAVLTFDVPPLRERVVDIPLLVEHFVREEGSAGLADALLCGEALERLKRHSWPGNVRELKNYVLATLAMGEPAQLYDGGPVHRDAFRNALTPLLDQPYAKARADVVEMFERAYVSALLGRSAGNVAQAARAAGIARSYLNELLRRHKLHPKSGVR